MGKAEVYIPKINPGGQGFMVFSFLLLGVLFVLFFLLIEFSVGNGISGLKNAADVVIGLNIPQYMAVGFGLLALTSVGFFLFVFSFIAFSAPAFFLKNRVQEKSNNSLFNKITELALKEKMGEQVLCEFNAKHRYAFIYLETTRGAGSIAQSVRFAFTQVIFARSVLSILLFYAFCFSVWSQVNLFFQIAVPLFVWSFCIAVYMVAVEYLENLMACAYVVRKSDVSEGGASS